MPVTQIKIRAEIILLVTSDAPVSKLEEDTLVVEMEKILNNTTPIRIPPGGEINPILIGTRFHFLEVIK